MTAHSPLTEPSTWKAERLGQEKTYVNRRNTNKLLQPLQLPRNDRARRPRTRIADVQMIAALLGGELGARIGRDPVAERALLALELARLVAGLDPVGHFEAGGSLSSGWASVSQLAGSGFEFLSNGVFACSVNCGGCGGESM